MSKRIELEVASSSVQSTELWYKDYMKEGGKVGTQTLLLSVYPGDKGLLLLGNGWKDFVFKGRSSHKEIINLLERYCKDNSKSTPLLMESTTKKSGDLLILETYTGDSVWVKEGKNYRFDCLSEEFEMTEENPNPVGSTSGWEEEEETPRIRSSSKASKKTP